MLQALYMVEAKRFYKPDLLIYVSRPSHVIEYLWRLRKILLPMVKSCRLYIIFPAQFRNLNGTAQPFQDDSKLFLRFVKVSSLLPYIRLGAKCIIINFPNCPKMRWTIQDHLVIMILNNLFIETLGKKDIVKCIIASDGTGYSLTMTKYYRSIRENNRRI